MGCPSPELTAQGQPSSSQEEQRAGEPDLLWLAELTGAHIGLPPISQDPEDRCTIWENLVSLVDFQSPGFPLTSEELGSYIDIPRAPSSSSSSSSSSSPSSSSEVPLPQAVAWPPLPPEDIDYKTNPHVKPPYSYATLICMAMEASSKPKLALADICKWIRDNFCYFRRAHPSWQSSIRHNLCINKRFVKVPREKGEPGRGAFWKLHPQYAGWLKSSSSKGHGTLPEPVPPVSGRRAQPAARRVRSPAASAAGSRSSLEVGEELQRLLQEFEDFESGHSVSPVGNGAEQQRQLQFQPQFQQQRQLQDQLQYQLQGQQQDQLQGQQLYQQQFQLQDQLQFQQQCELLQLLQEFEEFESSHDVNPVENGVGQQFQLQDQLQYQQQFQLQDQQQFQQQFQLQDQQQFQQQFQLQDQQQFQLQDQQQFQLQNQQQFQLQDQQQFQLQDQQQFQLQDQQQFQLQDQQQFQLQDQQQFQLQDQQQFQLQDQQQFQLQDQQQFQLQDQQQFQLQDQLPPAEPSGTQEEQSQLTELKGSTDWEALLSSCPEQGDFSTLEQLLPFTELGAFPLEPAGAGGQELGWPQELEQILPELGATKPGLDDTLTATAFLESVWHDGAAQSVSSCIPAEQGAENIQASLPSEDVLDWDPDAFISFLEREDEFKFD